MAAAPFAVAISIAALLATTVAPAVEVSPSAQPSPSPRQLLALTFQRLQTYPLPPYAVWSDTWRTLRSGPGDARSSAVYQMRYAVRMSDGAENGTPFPVTETTVPIAQIGHQFLGPFAFSLRSVQTPPHGISLQPDIPSPLKTIASVVAYSTPYDIELAGIENVSGHSVYHLRLRARSDPQRHNLRDLWVDVATYDLWQAHFIGTYAPDASSMESTSDVTARFTQAGEYWVVSRAVWTWDDYENSATFVFDVLTNAMTFPSSLPDWLFDARAYRQHEAAKDPDYLAPLLSPSPGP